MDKPTMGMAFVGAAAIAWLAWTVSASLARFGRARSDLVFARRRVRTIRDEVHTMLFRLIRVGVLLAVAAAVLIGVAKAAVPH